MNTKTKARVQIGNRWVTFKSVKSVKAFMRDAGITSINQIEKYYTMFACVQVFVTLQGVNIRVITTKGV